MSKVMLKSAEGMEMGTKEEDAMRQRQGRKAQRWSSSVSHPVCNGTTKSRSSLAWLVSFGGVAPSLSTARLLRGVLSSQRRNARVLIC